MITPFCSSMRAYACLAIINVHISRSPTYSIYLDNYSCRSLRISFNQANYQPTNIQPSTARVVWSSTAHPTCSLTSHTSTAKMEGVAFLFGNPQSLESQSGYHLYSTIHNYCLTTHSKSIYGSCLESGKC